MIEITAIIGILMKLLEIFIILYAKQKKLNKIKSFYNIMQPSDKINRTKSFRVNRKPFLLNDNDEVKKEIPSTIDEKKEISITTDETKENEIVTLTELTLNDLVISNDIVVKDDVIIKQVKNPLKGKYNKN